MTQKELIAALDRWLAGNNPNHPHKPSPMAGFADYMVILAREAGIAVTLSVAVAQAETQCATDPAADPDDIAGHNAWGYGHWPNASHGWLFPTWPDGICAVTDWLARGYVYQGLTTVDQVCMKWVGSSSASWIANVSSVMRLFGGDPMKLQRTPLMHHGDGTPPSIVHP